MQPWDSIRCASDGDFLVQAEAHCGVVRRTTSMLNSVTAITGQT